MDHFGPTWWDVTSASASEAVCFTRVRCATVSVVVRTSMEGDSPWTRTVPHSAPKVPHLALERSARCPLFPEPSSCPRPSARSRPAPHRRSAVSNLPVDDLVRLSRTRSKRRGEP